MTPQDEAESLMAQGYAIVSRAYRIAARVDRADWLRGQQDTSYDAKYDPDYYRRVLSNDKIQVSEAVRKYMLNSGDAEYGYRPKTQ